MEGTPGVPCPSCLYHPPPPTGPVCSSVPLYRCTAAVGDAYGNHLSPFVNAARRRQRQKARLKQRLQALQQQIRQLQLQQVTAQ